jgi:exosortase
MSRTLAIGAAAGLLYTLAIHRCVEIALEQRSLLPASPLASPRIPLPIALAAIAFLVHARRREIRADARGWTLGRAGLALAGLGIFGWGCLVGAPDLATAGLVVTLLATASSLVTPASARLLAGLLGPLLFCAQIPGTAFNSIVFELQALTAWGAEKLIAAYGGSVLREGTVLWIPEARTSVIETCSGLGTLHTTTALLSGYTLYGGLSIRRGLVLALLGGALAIGGNVARVAWMAGRPEGVAEPLHSVIGGLVAITASVIPVLLDRLSALPVSRNAGIRSHASHAWPGPGRIYAGLAVATLVAVVAVGVPQQTSDREPWTPRLPLRLGASKLASTPSQYRARASLASDWQVHQRFVGPGPAVEVLLAWDALNDRARSLISPMNELPGPDWSREEQGPIDLGESWKGCVTIAARGREREVVWTLYAHAGDPVTETLRELAALDQSPWGRREGVRLVRLATPIEAGPDGRARADFRLREVFTTVAGLAPAGGPAMESAR